MKIFYIFFPLCSVLKLDEWKEIKRKKHWREERKKILKRKCRRTSPIEEGEKFLIKNFLNESLEDNKSIIDDDDNLSWEEVNKKN